MSGSVAGVTFAGWQGTLLGRGLFGGHVSTVTTSKVVADMTTAYTTLASARALANKNILITVTDAMGNTVNSCRVIQVQGKEVRAVHGGALIVIEWQIRPPAGW